MTTSQSLSAPSNEPLKIGLVAGEISGDILGAGLIKAIKQRYPNAQFFGIGGPKMIEQGCESWFNMEELAVMGIVEVLGRLPRLFKLKAQLVQRMQKMQPDVFIGIDAPDFNLRLERNLKDMGIKTVHYVSPSVWAWRQKRVFAIQKATNLVLAFLPFEKAFYDRFNVPCRFIGHTMADAIPLHTDREAAKESLGLEASKTWLAVLPGSRGSEMEMLAQPFIKACQLIKAQRPETGFIVPVVNEKRRQQFIEIQQQTVPDMVFQLVDSARDAMVASDAVLLASGTAALEAMLVGRPMVVGYIVKPFTYWLANKLVKTDYVSLPNILASEEIVPELLQEACTPEALAEKMLEFLASDNQALLDRFTQLHQGIRKNADQQAAQAVIELIKR